jgi:NADH dehydrogenase [ubiquinone] 1 alpha subcomplex assembly factor 5
MEIFSNQHKWMQKERAAANTEASRSVDYLRDEVASRLCERILVSSRSTSSRLMLTT